MQSKLSLEHLERVPLEDGMSWLPIRRTLGVTGFSVNGYVADGPGDTVIETHDETGSGSGGHEELYLVTRGRAAFKVGEDEVELGSGEMLFVDPQTTRGATALEAGTTVMVVAGRPGDALPVSPFEHWYSAIPAREAGDYDTAYATIEKAFDDYPGHARIHFELACLRALQHRRADALGHLRAAIDGEPRCARWAREDSDFDSLRDDPDFVKLVS
jgi:quercetin dioxygenase-like cupin family protein